ncbi:hypothetical protein JCM8097_003876 [Rhodosporidiobolus ruineniae]
MDDYNQLVKDVPLLVLVHADTSYIVKTPPTLSSDNTDSKGLDLTALRLFPNLDKSSLRFEVSFSGSEFDTLTAEAYLPTLSLLAKSSNPPRVRVIDSQTSARKKRRGSCELSEEESADRKRCERSKSPTVEAKPLVPRVLEGSLQNETIITIQVRFTDGTSICIKCKSSTSCGRIYQSVARNLALDSDQFRLMHKGMRLEDRYALQDYGIHDGAVVDGAIEQVGGKPVVYLFPPAPLPSANVTLALSPQWSFSALYPIVDVKKGKEGDSTASWTVSAGPDGSLVELASGLALSYLFWEAHSLALPHSPPASPPLAASPAFDPSRPSLNSANGIVLPFFFFLSYLDKTLSSLTLHTAARTDFITYWLPAFNRIHARKQLIAFRFLPQAEYEQAAKLEVDPKPDVVTRVFMLFRGVEEAEADGWRKPEEVDWAGEVGVKVDEAKDEGLFRVLEWGGMEVVG